MLIISDHARERGRAANDVTSYLACQKEWGPDRDRDWPKIKDNVLHRFDRQGYPIPDYKPEIWYDAGRIVLDPDNHAILKYKIIPATLSSELSGRDMEAMRRLDLRIIRKDFRARMPRSIFTDKGKKQVKKPLHSLSAIAMRTTRFRKENGMISWIDREGSDTIRKYALGRMPRANIDANSTQGMRSPTLFEQEDSRNSNKGKYLSRAGRRALPDEVRKERARKEEERMQKLHAAHNEVKEQLTARVCAKRKRDDDGMSEPEEDLPQRKRSRAKDPLQVSPSDPNIASSFLTTPSPRVQSQHTNSSLPAQPLAGHKRSHEQVSSDDKEPYERQSKRRHSQVEPSQPTTSSTSCSHPPPRSLRHQPPSHTLGETASGNPVSTSAGDINDSGENP